MSSSTISGALGSASAKATVNGSTSTNTGANGDKQEGLNLEVANENALKAACEELNWKVANERTRKAACELKMSNEDSAAGSLYEIESGEQLRHLFVSANRRLLVKSFDDLCKAQLLLHVLPEDGCVSIHLSGDRVCDVWNTRSRGEHTGNTVVELSAEAVRECKSRGANFLKIGEARPGEEVRLK